MRDAWCIPWPAQQFAELTNQIHEVMVGYAVEFTTQRWHARAASRRYRVGPLPSPNEQAAD